MPACLMYDQDDLVLVALDSLHELSRSDIEFEGPLTPGETIVVDGAEYAVRVGKVAFVDLSQIAEQIPAEDDPDSMIPDAHLPDEGDDLSREQFVLFNEDTGEAMEIADTDIEGEVLIGEVYEIDGAGWRVHHRKILAWLRD